MSTGSGSWQRRGHLPVVVGGTGFYIQALLYDIDFTEEDSDPAYRKELETLAQTDGKALYRKLLTVDPQAAEDIHPHNHKRLIRALEYFHLTGERISGHNRRMRRKQSPYRFCYFVLTDERGRISERKDVPLFDYEAFHEAVKMVEQMPRWIPAHNDGKPISSYFVLPIEYSKENVQ